MATFGPAVDGRGPKVGDAASLCVWNACQEEKMGNAWQCNE